jgi:hypothetical protein
MKKRILTEEVVIEGPTFLGGTGRLILKPRSEPGWTWNGRLISVADLKRRRRRLRLEHDGEVLEIFEHIGPLAFAGFSSLAIEGRGWPPYYGRALELLDAALDTSVETETELPVFSFDRPIPGMRDEGRYLEVNPSVHPELVVDIEINYPGLGYIRREFRFPDLQLLRKVSMAYTQGWPKWLKYPALAGHLMGWPHFHRITWPNGTKSELTLEQFSAHRCQDLLGALSLICPGGILAGRVHSHCAGHSEDMILLQNLRPLRAVSKITT